MSVVCVYMGIHRIQIMLECNTCVVHVYSLCTVRTRLNGERRRRRLQYWTSVRARTVNVDRPPFPPVSIRRPSVEQRQQLLTTIISLLLLLILAGWYFPRNRVNRSWSAHWSCSWWPDAFAGRRTTEPERTGGKRTASDRTTESRCRWRAERAGSRGPRKVIERWSTVTVVTIKIYGLPNTNWLSF